MLAANATPPKLTRVAVSELEAGYGADAKLAHALSGLLTVELRKHSGLLVTSQQDIKNLLGFQRQKQLLNCGDTSCLSEIGGALGVDQMVTGAYSRVGDSFLLDVRAIDVKKAQVLRDASRRLRTTDQDALLDAIAELAAELYPEAASPPRVPRAALAAPAQRPNRTGPIALGVAGTAIGIVGGILWLNAVHAGGKETYGAQSVYGLTYPQAQGRNGEASWGGALFVGGLVAAVCGLGWGVFQP